MRFKALLSLILSFAVIASTLSFTASAVKTGYATAGQTAGSDFLIDKNGELVKYSGSGGKVTIPDNVKSIGDYAFTDCTGLTGIIIPDSVTSIGDDAFMGCYLLSSVSIPGSVKSIGSSAFEGTLWLTFYPASFVVVGNGILIKYKGLNANVTIPGNVKTIGDSAFAWSSIIKSVIIPNTVTAINYEAFYSCSKLTSVTIGSGVTEIDHGSFYSCNSLTQINVNSLNKYYSSQDGVLFNKSKTALLQYPPGKTGSYVIPDSVSDVDGFFYCEKITGVTLGKNAADIDWLTFCGCDSLKQINVSSLNQTYTSQDGVLFNKAKTMLLLCPEGRTGDYSIPNGVARIETDAFYGCGYLTGITIPAGITRINEYTFDNCRGLKNVAIPNSVTEIGSSAFSGCSALSGITIPGSVKVIGDYVFFNCISLSSVVIPDSVNSIGYNAFWETPWLNNSPGDFLIAGDHILVNYKGEAETAAIPDGVKSIGPGAFEYNNYVMNVIIPSSVRSIGYCAFSECYALTSVNIPDSVTSIGASAFYGCSKLNTVTVPNSVNSIGSGAFSDTPFFNNLTGEYIILGNGILVSYTGSATSVTIPGNVKSIGNDAFFENAGLKSVIIPNSVTSIGSNAFSDCTALSSVTIPGSIKSIGAFAFDETPWLHNYKGEFVIVGDHVLISYKGYDSNITVPVGVKSIADGAFFDIFYLEGISIPSSVSNIAEGTFDYIKDIKIYCPAGSYAEAYAIDNGITHSPIINISKITLSTASLSLAAGKTGKLTVTVSPANASNKSVSWSSGNTKVAAVNSNGIITAVGAGTTTITCAAKDGSGVKATCKINVAPAAPTGVKAVKASSTSISLTWGKVSGITGYEVYRSASLNGTYTKIKTLSANCCTDSGLTKGKTYYYKIKAYTAVNGVQIRSSPSSAVYVKL